MLTHLLAMTIKHEIATNPLTRILAMTALVHFVAMTKKHEIATILLSQNLAMTEKK